MHVAFDIGNVLFDFKMKQFIDSFQEEIDLYNDSHKFYGLNRITKDPLTFLKYTQAGHDIGLFSKRQAIEFHFDFSPAVVDRLMVAWDATLQMNNAMFSFVQKLVAKGINVALLSNMGVEHMNLLKRMPEMSQLLNEKNVYSYFSCDLGIRKPSQLYYKHFSNSNLLFNGCLYVDDLQENLDVAQKFGFDTYRFALDESIPEQIELAIEHIGSEVKKRVMWQNPKAIFDLNNSNKIRARNSIDDIQDVEGAFAIE